MFKVNCVSKKAAQNISFLPQLWTFKTEHPVSQSPEHDEKHKVTDVRYTGPLADTLKLQL